MGYCHNFKIWTRSGLVKDLIILKFWLNILPCILIYTRLICRYMIPIQAQLGRVKAQRIPNLTPGARRRLAICHPNPLCYQFFKWFPIQAESCNNIYGPIWFMYRYYPQNYFRTIFHRGYKSKLISIVSKANDTYCFKSEWYL